MIPFAAIVTPQSVSFTAPNGKVHNITDAHINYVEIISTIKELQAAIKLEDQPLVEELHAKLATLADVANTILEASEGKVTVRSGVVYYEEEAIHSALAERIIWGLREGFDMSAYMNFLQNAMENPSKRAVDETYSFLEKNNMGITEDGYILGYKRVRGDFMDIYSGKFDNSPGNVVEIRRNTVDDDKSRTCSTGLHFCSLSYLPFYSSANDNKVVIVKVHPRDIVSVPIDYNHAKVRCCRYEVLSEYTGPIEQDYLASRAVWSDSDFSDDDDEVTGDDWDTDDDWGTDDWYADSDDSDFDSDLDGDADCDCGNCDNCCDDDELDICLDPECTICASGGPEFEKSEDIDKDYDDTDYQPTDYLNDKLAEALNRIQELENEKARPESAELPQPQHPNADKLFRLDPLTGIFVPVDDN